MPLEIWGLKYAECIWVWVYPPKTNIAPETWWGWETTVLSLLGNPFKCENVREGKLGGGFKYFLFSPLFGDDSHFD